MGSKWEADGLSAENLALAVMNEMAKDMSVDGDRVGVMLGDYEFAADALYGLIKHDFDMADETLFKEFDKALKHCFKQDLALTNAKKLLSEFDTRCGALLRNKKTYVMVTTLSLANAVLHRRTIKGCKISFHAKLPAKYRAERARVIQIKNKHDINVENEGYVFAVVKVSAPDNHTAFEDGMDALSIFRGLCQLHTRKAIRMFPLDGNARYPSDPTLKLGNLHTMHGVDGKASMEAHWFEDFPRHERPTTFNGLPLLEQEVGKLLAKLARAPAPYRAFCEKLLLNYVAAIDCRDPEARFVKLWLCLELITNVDDAKQIIKRVVFFYAQQDFARGLLRSLRAARNSQVHGGAKPPRIDLKNFKMCEFIEHLLLVILGNHFKFSTSSQWQDFMSTTTDMASIDKQIEQLKMVRRFVTPEIDIGVNSSLEV